jgi:hypothetical protein
MNRLLHHTKVSTQAPTTPLVVRRVIRYRAADNARQAIRRQFPELFSDQVTRGQGATPHAR